MGQTSLLIDIGYIAASILFILGIKMLSKPQTAVKGNMISAVGMLIAICITLLMKGLSYHWILIGIVIGTVIGGLAARLVKMTAMPEMVALFNGFGGIASLLVGWAQFNAMPDLSMFTGIATFFAILIGGVAFSGSMIAYAKLAEKMSGKPILFKGQQFVNILMLVALIGAGVLWVINPTGPNAFAYFMVIVALSLIRDFPPEQLFRFGRLRRRVYHPE